MTCVIRIEFLFPIKMLFVQLNITELVDCLVDHKISISQRQIYRRNVRKRLCC